MLSVRHTGSPGGEQAFMIHGLGGSSHNWTDLADELSLTTQSTIPDLPGFGWSPPPRDGDYSVAGHANAMIDLLDHEGRGPVHLFGNSLGGAVSVRVAALRPDLVRSLTLISPALPSGPVSRTGMLLPVMAVPGLGEAAVARSSEVPVEARVRSVADLCFAQPDAIPAHRMREAIIDAQARDSLPYQADALLQSLRGLMRSYLAGGRTWSLAKSVTAPTLAIYGRDDQLVDPRGAFKVTREFPDASVIVLPRTGHVAQIEQPALVAELWRNWVSGAVRP